MRRIKTLREIQLIEFEILKVFKKFCDINGIKYNLFYGTLLGAVRHKGFIPWDDDIDVVLLKKEYERMICLLKKERTLGSKDCYARIPGDKGYHFPFVKIVNKNTIVFEGDGSKSQIWIDVFPVNYVYDSQAEREKLLERMAKINYLGHIAGQTWDNCKREHPNHKMLQFIRWRGLNLIGAGFFVNLALHKSKLDNHSHKLVGNIVWNSYKDRDSYPVTVLKRQRYIEFEGELFSAPADYDYVLKKMYGDYMKLPPEEEQRSHGVKAFYL